MTDGLEKLRRDVSILSAMASQTAPYLDNERVLFWPLSSPALPRLTLGGFLLRRHRLVQLFDLLPAERQDEVQAALTLFNGALEGRTVRFERKAQQEIGARIRQWAAGLGDHLAEVRRGNATASFLATTVEVRAILAALLEEMGSYPYHLDPVLVRRVAEIDQQLRARWVRGPFLWAPEWAPAYPQEAYWWLYGHAR